jgi:hypothetical protein
MVNVWNIRFSTGHLQVKNFASAWIAGVAGATQHDQQTTTRLPHFLSLANPSVPWTLDEIA